MAFLAIIFILLAVDLGVFNRKDVHISVKKAVALTVFWIALALVFGVYVLMEYGTQSATEYYTAYVIEKAMSVDNLFIFMIIFAYFKIPDEYQHRALFYGILGAIAFRFVFIITGIELINRFHWIVLVFGVLLLYIAVKTIVQTDKDEKAAENAVVRFFRRFMKVSDECDGHKLFTVKDGVRMATPLLLAIIAIESADLIFAMDSVPAVLAVTRDRFIAYTSNIFAILGLRSMYFALRGALEHLKYLKYGLGAILGFVGMKFMISYWHPELIPVWVSLVVILTMLTVTAAISVYATRGRPGSPS